MIKNLTNLFIRKKIGKPLAITPSQHRILDIYLYEQPSTPSSNSWIFIDGAQRSVTETYVMVGGAWKLAVEQYICIGNQWKRYQ